MEQIELRSEKVRNIIGQIPPKTVRYGITVLFIVFVLMILLSYYFKFAYSISTTAIIKKENNKYTGIIKIPANEVSKIKTGNTVRLYFNNIPNMTDEYVESKIINTSKAIAVSNTSAFSYSAIQIPDSLISNKGNKIILSENITTNAEILTERLSFFQRIFHQFKVR